MKKKVLSSLTASVIALGSALSFSAIAEDTIWGDIDGDGKLTAIDARLLLVYNACESASTSPEQLDEMLSTKVFHINVFPFSFTDDEITRLKMFADYNQDGETNPSDVSAILDDIGYIRGDVNCDGVVTSEDANIVLKFYAAFSAITGGDDYSNADVTYQKLIESYGYTDTEIKLISIIGDADQSGMINSSDAAAILELSTDKILGDVNGDGVVNASDSSMVMAYYSESSSGKAKTSIDYSVADFNGDGVVNASDASEILSYYANGNK